MADEANTVMTDEADTVMTDEADTLMTDEARTLMPMMLGANISLEPVTEARPLASGLQFSIATDSVVATATVTPSGPVKKIHIAWGDGETSSLTTRPGVPTPQTTILREEDNPLPAGTYQLTHVYPEPEDRMPYETDAIALVNDWAGGEEINLTTVTIAPRYRCTNYRTEVRLTGPCDSESESTSEFDITQFVGAVTRRKWHWEPSNNFFSDAQFFLLEDSQISREMTAPEPGVTVHFHFKETDPIFDDALDFSTLLHATLESNKHITHEISALHQTFGNCGIAVRYAREVSLIVPLPESGQQVVFA